MIEGGVSHRRRLSRAEVSAQVRRKDANASTVLSCLVLYTPLAGRAVFRAKHQAQVSRKDANASSKYISVFTKKSTTKKAIFLGSLRGEGSSKTPLKQIKK
jgi:hypothetical protein